MTAAAPARPADFHAAKRENIALLLGVAGGTGSGKTMSAMRLAKGLAGGKRFAVVDTENGRASHYADQFEFDVAELRAPYRPERYTELIRKADAAGYPVIMVDSMSHEWAGDGGLLDWHEVEFKRMGGRDAVKLAAWVAPKMAHRKFVSELLQVKAHLILCFRAAERIEMVKNPETKKMEIVPKVTRTGRDGWVPITEKDLPFELTASFLLTEDQPGVPQPIKLQEQHRLLVPLDKPLSEETGTALGSWAQGETDDVDERVTELVAELLSCAEQLGKRDETTAAIQRHRQRNGKAAHVTWLDKQLAAAQTRVAELDEGEALFEGSD